ncbi:MAG: hypothetical protein IPM18_16595 [Phycisphaerales bacterium]|nr:hypothetical protein [Phycisphaerales bacterium]
MRSNRDEGRKVGPRRPWSGCSLGFALLEILLVVVILAVIGGLALPRFHSALQRQRVEAAAQRVISDLDLAQRQARTTNAAVTVFFDPLGPRYAVQGLAHLDRAGATYAVDLGQQPYEVGMSFSAKNGANAVVFDGYGQPSGDMRIELRAGDAKAVVLLDPTTGAATRE